MRNKKIINDRQYRYAIRKLNVGVVSVAVSALMFLGGPVALADQNAADTTAGETEIVDTAPEAQAPPATTSVTGTQENESPTIDSEVAQLAENSATATISEVPADEISASEAVSETPASEHPVSEATANEVTSEASADEVFSSEAISEIPADNAISSVATSSESLNYSETAINEADAITEEAPVAEPTPQADDTAVNETLAGYTTSAPETTATIVDPVKGHYTLEVIQDNDTGVTYVFSIDETVNEADLLADNGAKNVYMTRFKNGNVISTDTIDRSAAKGTSLTYDDTEIVILSKNDLQLGTTKTGTYRVLYNAASTPSGQDVATINISVVKALKQVTQYVNELTGEAIRDPYVQTAWGGFNYTTQPIEIEGYTYTHSTNNETGTVSSTAPRNKGDVVYLKSETTAAGDGGESIAITIYRKLEFIDENQTANPVIYMTPRVDDGEAVDAKTFFENIENYTVYNDKIYVPTDDLSQPNSSGIPYSELASNDKNAYYLARIATTPAEGESSVTAFFKAPITADQPVNESMRFVVPYVGPVNFYQQNMSNKLNSPNKKTTSSYVVYYYMPQGEVVVNYVDTAGNVIKDPVVDTAMTNVQVDGNPVTYDTTDKRDSVIRTTDGKTYKYKEIQSGSALETGELQQGTTNVTYVYEEVKGDVVVLYRTTDGAEITGIGSNYPDDPTKTITIGNVTDTETEEKTAWTGAVIDTAASSTGTAYDTSDSRPETITTADGKVYHRTTKVAGAETGNIVEGTTRIVYYYELAKGSVKVAYVDTEGNMLQPDIDVLTDVDSGTTYDTLSAENRPTEIKVGEKTYRLVPAGNYQVGEVGADGNLTATTTTLGTDATTGTVSDTTKVITYVYEEIKGSVTIHYVDEDGNIIKDPVVDEVDVPVGSEYDTTDEGDKPTKVVTADGKTYELVPEKTKGNETGTVVEGNTDVTYVYREIKGDVVVTYVDINGNTIKAQVTDTPTTSTGTAYDTSDNRPETITTADGKLYQLVPAGEYAVGVVDADSHLTNSDTTTGMVSAGTKTVTYVYRELGSYVPYIPGEPDKEIPNVPYDDTPEEPNDNPPLPYIPGYTPKDPNGDPLVPVDPEDPTKGYIPPPITDPNDPGKDTPVPYEKDPTPETPKGNVVVKYVNEAGEMIAEDVVDTPDSDVDTAYDTTDNKPRIIEKDGKRYIFTKIKEGDTETGKVTEGTTTVTYIYKELGSYVPYIPEEPGKEIPKVPYDDTPEEPNDNPPLPYIPGYTPKDPNGDPLVPVDPEDPTKGYIPPPITDPNDPGKDTPVPYEKDPDPDPTPETPKGNVVVKYVDEQGNFIAEDVVDTPDSDVDTEYDTTDNKPQIIEKEGKRYIFTKVKDGDNETGKVTEGTTTVTYIYKELGSYVPYIPEEPGKEIPNVPYDDTPEEPNDNPPLPYIPGYTPKDPNGDPLVPVDPEDPTKGYIPPPITDPNDPGKDTPVPYEKDPEPTPAEEKGSVTVRYVDENGNEVKDPVFDEVDVAVGTEYDTTDNKPRIIEKDGKRYIFAKVQAGSTEQGKVTNGTTTVTYIYKELGSYVPYIPSEPGKEIPKVPYDDTPEEPNDNPPLPYIPGYTPKDPNGDPLVPVDPTDPTKGYIPPPITDPNDPGKDTPVPYEKDPEPTPTEERGSVTVRYVDGNGNEIKAPVFDETDVVVGTAYDTTDNKPQIIEKDGKRYIFAKVQAGSTEQGKVTKGATTVTYIYKELGSYVPYIPGEPAKEIPNVPYDDTPEEPNDNPPLPYIPGYTPKDPSTGEPLRPVDPTDLTKGYIPPTISDPNDPSKDTPVPYEKDPEQEKAPITLEKQTNDGQKPNNPGAEMSLNQPQTQPTMNRETLNKPAMQANEAKELPQTGENEASGLASLGILSIMAGSLGLFFSCKKDDEKTN